MQRSPFPVVLTVFTVITGTPLVYMLYAFLTDDALRNPSRYYPNAGTGIAAGLLMWSIILNIPIALMWWRHFGKRRSDDSDEVDTK